MDYKQLSTVYHSKFIADKAGGIDPRTGRKLSKKELLDYDGPICQFKDMEAYLKQSPVLGEDYVWIHQDGTPLTEEEVEQLVLK